MIKIIDNYSAFQFLFCSTFFLLELHTNRLISNAAELVLVSD